MVENRRLQDLICDIKVPTEMVPEIKDGKERMVEHKLFPGYVLVKMVVNDDTSVSYTHRRCRGPSGPAGQRGQRPECGSCRRSGGTRWPGR